MTTTRIPPEELEQAVKVVGAMRTQIARAMVGQAEVVEQTLAALLAGGHVLIEGVPGLGKTLLVRALAKTFDGRFARAVNGPGALTFQPTDPDPVPWST